MCYLHLNLARVACASRMFYSPAGDVEGAFLYLTNPFRGLGFPLALLCAAMGTAATSVSAVAGDVSGEPSSLESAALTRGLDESDGQPVLPRILSAADEVLYREIFALQVDGHWKEADRRIAGLGDRLLMGHVLAQRYLHPTKYRSRYTELKSWMANYADHPEARRIYKLALRRKPEELARPETADRRPSRRRRPRNRAGDGRSAAQGPDPRRAS